MVKVQTTMAVITAVMVLLPERVGTSVSLRRLATTLVVQLMQGMAAVSIACVRTGGGPSTSPMRIARAVQQTHGRLRALVHVNPGDVGLSTRCRKTVDLGGASAF